MTLSPLEQDLDVLLYKEHEKLDHAGIIEESHTRSIAKGITWRVVASLTTVLVSWIVIQDVSSALRIGFFEAILKIGIYYLHERIWAKIAL